jgi:integrase/recombinase XerC
VKVAREVGLISWGLTVRGLRKERRREVRGPGLEGVRLLLLAAEQAPPWNQARDRLIIRLAYDLALRVGEVVRLELEDVEPGGLRVRRKGRREPSHLELPETTERALELWLRARENQPERALLLNERGGPLTASGIRWILRSLASRVGLKQVRPHGLRRTAITRALALAQAQGLPLGAVLTFSNHRDMRTLFEYRDAGAKEQLQVATLVSREAISTKVLPR